MSFSLPFPVPDMTYDEALARLGAALRFGIVPLIETVEDMLVECGDPDLRFRCVQVAGTNGKTLTSRYTAAILAGEGLKVALYTSPELVRYNERMEVGGRPVTDEVFAHSIAAAAEAGRRVNERRLEAGERPYDITEFDLLTVAACVAFAEAGVDVCVLEVGMGGRWDATSAVRSIEAVAVTGIGLDHTRVLGDTLEQIAHEKAAVIARGRACVLGVGCATPTTVEDVFLDRCADQGVEPVLVRASDERTVTAIMHPGVVRAHEGRPCTTFAVTAAPDRLGAPLVFDVVTPRATYGELGALKPIWQAANVACAVSLAEAFLERALDREALLTSVVTCPTPGRFDLVRPKPLGLIDACHNPQSVEAFLCAVEAIEPEVSKRPTLLVAVLADKDVASIVALLAPSFPACVVCQTPSPRALAAPELAAVFRAHGCEPVACFDTVGAALGYLRDTPFVACGSITLAGEVARILRGEPHV